MKLRHRRDSSFFGAWAGAGKRLCLSLYLTTILAAQTTATFVKTDTATQGSWRGVYGADGYNVIGSAVLQPQNPSYAAITPAGNYTYLWTSSTADLRALQAATGRIAACWYGGVFSINLAFSDTALHQFALYLLDWDKYGNGRTERVDILDPNGNVLNSQSASGFANGEYLVWNVSGHVVVRITNTNPAANAVVSGLFFDRVPVPPPPPTTAIKVLPPLVLDATTNTISCPGCLVPDSSGNLILNGSLTTNANSPGASQITMKDGSGKPWYLCVNSTGNLVIQATPCSPTPPSSPIAASFSTEIPSGAIDGTNTVFALAHPPNPPASLRLYRNGLRMSAGNDFTLTGNTISFVNDPNAIPEPGAVLIADYRW